MFGSCFSTGFSTTTTTAKHALCYALGRILCALYASHIYCSFGCGRVQSLLVSEAEQHAAIAKAEPMPGLCESHATEPQDNEIQCVLQEQPDQSNSVGGISELQLPAAARGDTGKGKAAAAKGKLQPAKLEAPARSQRTVKRSRKARDSEELGTMQTTWAIKPPTPQNVEAEAPPSPVIQAAAWAGGPVIQTGATDGLSPNYASFLDLFAVDERIG